MKAVRTPVLSALRGRYYSAQAATKSSAQKHEPQVTKLPNGVVCVSHENYTPVARVGIIYNAGPRTETGNDVGITHYLRCASNLSTQHSTAFGLARNVEQLGASFSCSASREHIAYTMDCTRDNINAGIEFLGHAATAPSFKPWEIESVKDRIRLDIAALEQQPEVQLVEALHKAAYRTGLGNSLYLPAHKINSFSPDQLHQFVQKHFTGENATVVGVGVDHDVLVAFAKKSLGVSSSASSASPSKPTVSGDQVRIDSLSPLVHAAVVSEGVGISGKDVLTAGLLQKVMGTGPFVKYSNNPLNKLHKGVGQEISSPFAASCINFNYSDSGLFGFYVVAHSDDAGKVLKSVMSTFAKATKDGINNDDVARAKAQLKAAMFMELETSDGVFKSVANQAAIEGEALNPTRVAAAIDSITLDEIRSLAQKIVSGKASMAAVGNLSHTPYLEHLLV